jgi:hypothetical protein
VHRKRGAKVFYTNLGATSVQFVLSRCARSVKGHCKRYRRVRSFVRHDAPGDRHFRLKVRHLKLGRYRLTATPTLQGAKGATVKVSFKIIR